MNLSEINNLAHNAHISIKHLNQEILMQEINEIIEFASKINLIDLKNVAPFEFTLVPQNKLRPDLKKDSLPVETVLLNAPEKENGFIVVPKVV